MLEKMLVQRLLKQADITVGQGPDVDITVYNDQFYSMAFRKASLGLGESYMQGFCDIRDIASVTEKCQLGGIDTSIVAKIAELPLYLQHLIHDLHSSVRERKKIADEHYNLHEGFYEKFLGPTMAYTSGMVLENEYYDFSQETLTRSQIRKFEHIANALQVLPGEQVLDVGCGYGGLLMYLQQERHAEVHGISNSVIQHNNTVYDMGIKKIPTFRYDLGDYITISKMEQKFDAVTSIEMIESVGPKHLDDFFQIIHDVLKCRGRFFLQAIVTDRHDLHGNLFLEKYIFPNAIINNEADMLKKASKYFKINEESTKNISESYIHTLACWDKAMLEAEKKGLYNFFNKNESFYRMFHFYFGISRGSFMSKRNRVMQYMFTK